ncbi:MAG: nuclear transport factor 2 family protein [Neisseriaceae bacterium]|nr:nuclear transport factor 2 family protein [Neisseriaceae bacterium]MBP6863295.1 nuclear transport factor 2 family protein [Neisseriaceae bacterium]
MKAHDILALVYQAEQALFTQHDLRSLTTYFSPQFVEHSPLVGPEPLEGLRQLVVEAGAGLRHEVVRAFVDGEYVVLHGRYLGLAPEPMVGFDIYRVQDGRITEHWDSLVPEASPNGSGRTQLDGDTQVDPEAPTEANRELVSVFFKEVLMNQRYDRIAHYANGPQFEQHSPDIEDGAKAMQAFLTELASEGKPLMYETLHRTLAAGQFVLTHSEGYHDGQRMTYCELWQVKNRKIAALWDAISPL